MAQPRIKLELTFVSPAVGGSNTANSNSNRNKRSADSAMVPTMLLDWTRTEANKMSLTSDGRCPYLSVCLLCSLLECRFLLL